MTNMPCEKLVANLERYSDVFLVGNDGGRVPAIKALLASRCDYFDHSFFGRQHKETLHEDFSCAVLRAVVEYSCSGTMSKNYKNSADAQELVHICIAADFYTLPDLSEIATEKMRSVLECHPELALVVMKETETEFEATEKLHSMASRVFQSFILQELSKGNLQSVSASWIPTKMQNQQHLESEPSDKHSVAWHDSESSGSAARATATIKPSDGTPTRKQLRGPTSRKISTRSTKDRAVPTTKTEEGDDAKATTRDPHEWDLDTCREALRQAKNIEAGAVYTDEREEDNGETAEAMEVDDEEAVPEPEKKPSKKEALRKARKDAREEAKQWAASRRKSTGMIGRKKGRKSIGGGSSKK